MGSLSRILLRSLGLQEGWTWRLLMHSSSPACFSIQLKVGFSSHCHRGGELPSLPSCTMQLLSTHLPSTACTLYQLPPASVLHVPPALGHLPVHMSTGHGRMAAELLVSTPNSFPRAGPCLSALTQSAWQSLNPLFLPLCCGADGDRCGTVLGCPCACPLHVRSTSPPG